MISSLELDGVVQELMDVLNKHKLTLSEIVLVKSMFGYNIDFMVHKKIEKLTPEWKKLIE